MASTRRAEWAGRALTTAGLFLAGIGLGAAAVFTVLYKLGGLDVCVQNGNIEDIRVGSTCVK